MIEGTTLVNPFVALSADVAMTSATMAQSRKRYVIEIP
jgi:hypothetical protein